MERILAFGKHRIYILLFRFAPEMNEPGEKRTRTPTADRFWQIKNIFDVKFNDKKELKQRNKKRQAHATETLHRRKKKGQKLRINMPLEKNSSTWMMTAQLQIHCFFPRQPWPAPSLPVLGSVLGFFWSVGFSSSSSSSSEDDDDDD